MLKYILILSLFLFQQKINAQSTLDSWSTERASLVTAYEAKPQKSLAKKISKIEGQVLEYIQTNGYPVQLLLPEGVESIEVHDKSYPLVGKVIKTLDNNATVLVLNKDKYGYYKIKVDDQIGYAYNIKTSPALDEYPLQLLTKSLEESEAVNNLQGYPSVFHVRNECPSIECGTINHAGEACKIMTRSCSGRCHLH